MRAHHFSMCISNISSYSFGSFQSDGSSFCVLLRLHVWQMVRKLLKSKIKIFKWTIGHILKVILLAILHPFKTIPQNISSIMFHITNNCFRTIQICFFSSLSFCSLSLSLLLSIRGDGSLFICHHKYLLTFIVFQFISSTEMLKCWKLLPILCVIVSKWEKRKKNESNALREKYSAAFKKKWGKILAKIVDLCKVAALKSAVFNLTTNILLTVWWKTFTPLFFRWFGCWFIVRVCGFCMDIVCIEFYGLRDESFYMFMVFLISFFFGAFHGDEKKNR